MDLDIKFQHTKMRVLKIQEFCRYKICTVRTYFLYFLRQTVVLSEQLPSRKK